jgi:competence transcription factor ComK
LYTPVRYATAYVPSYVSANSGNNAYGSNNMYASASEEKATVLAAPFNRTESCPSIKSVKSEACPIWINELSMELISKICSYELSRVKLSNLKQTQVSLDNSAKCHSIERETGMTKKVDNERKFLVTKNIDTCTIPAPKHGSDVFMLYNKSHVDGLYMKADKAMYIFGNYEIVGEINAVKKMC